MDTWNINQYLEEIVALQPLNYDFNLGAVLLPPVAPPADPVADPVVPPVVPPPAAPATRDPRTPWDAIEMSALRYGYAKYGRKTEAMLADPEIKSWLHPDRTPKATYQRLSGGITHNLPSKSDPILICMHHTSVSLDTWMPILACDEDGNWPSVLNVFASMLSKNFIRLPTAEEVEAHAGTKRKRTAAFDKAWMPSDVFLGVVELVSKTMSGLRESNMQTLKLLVQNSQLMRAAAPGLTLGDLVGAMPAFAPETGLAGLL